MITLSLATLIKVTEGKVVLPDVVLNSHTRLDVDTSESDDSVITHFVIDNLVIDSRAIEGSSNNKTAFLALKGPNFDGHRFAQQVIEQGCKLLIVDHQLTSITHTAQLIVKDTRIALGQIAAFVKKETSPKTVGITGSSGKTTVKEMVAAILSRLGNVLATKGNFNNDIGVPLTLLRLEHNHDFAVIEMGANHQGEIAYTAALTQPDIAIINNIAAAHLEGFGDLYGVARAKGEIFSGLSENGVAIYNQDTQYSRHWEWRLTDKTIRTFSCANTCNHSETTSVTNAVSCYSENVHLDEKGCAHFILHSEQGHCEVSLTIPGKHNVCNAVAAASIALEFGASFDDIRLGLAQMAPVQGRLNLHQLKDEKTGCNIKLIDDTYNANLESVKAAASLLSNYPGKTLLILGDMGELGSEAASYHQEVGEFAKHLDLNTLLSLGVLSQCASDSFVKNNNKNEQSQHFNQRTDLIRHLITLINQHLLAEQQDIAILVKGSRSAHMEHVVTDIITWFKKMNNQQNTHQESIDKENTHQQSMMDKNPSKEGTA